MHELTFGSAAGEDGGGAGVDGFAVHEEAVALGVQQPLDVGWHLVSVTGTHAASPAQEVTLQGDRNTGQVCMCVFTLDIGFCLLLGCDACVSVCTHGCELLL